MVIIRYDSRFAIGEILSKNVNVRLDHDDRDRHIRWTSHNQDISPYEDTRHDYYKSLLQPRCFSKNKKIKNSNNEVLISFYLPHLGIRRNIERI